MEAPPSPLLSRPEESWAFGPPKAMKNGSCSATTLNGSAALPFVISTGAPKERSGEICGVSGPSLGMFFDRAERGKFHDVSSPGFSASLRKTRLLDGELRSECEREDTLNPFDGLCQRLRLVEIPGDELHLVIEVGPGWIPGERPDLLSCHQQLRHHLATYGSRCSRYKDHV